MFIDWLDLKKGKNIYQDNKIMVRQIMVVICKVTGMVITYFTQLAKKNKNFFLLQDFMI